MSAAARSSSARTTPRRRWRRRLDLYDAQTAPLIARYQRAGKLVPVEATGTVDEVADRLIALIDSRLAGG